METAKNDKTIINKIFSIGNPSSINNLLRCYHITPFTLLESIYYSLLSKISISFIFKVHIHLRKGRLLQPPTSTNHLKVETRNKYSLCIHANQIIRNVKFQTILHNYAPSAAGYSFCTNPFKDSILTCSFRFKCSYNV